MFVPYVKAILDPHDTTLPRLECPAINETRYAHLRGAHPAAMAVDTGAPLKFLFALNLRQAKGVLPRLLGSVLQVARFLGPTACMLSIVEGNSDDGTPAILAALKPELARLGLRYRLCSSAIDPAAGDRIQRLADLRNAALAHILPTTTPADAEAENERATADAATTVLFLNDVAACADDILELAHQRTTQGAALTCALDWTYVGRDPTFYDVWVARALSGAPFFDVPADGSWDAAWNLLPAPGDAAARRRLAHARPFQAYACWNGAVAFTAAPLLGLPPSKGQADVASTPAGTGAQVAFRASREGECFMGEPTLFCKDLWWAGYGRIAVSTVSLPRCCWYFMSERASRHSCSPWWRLEMEVWLTIAKPLGSPLRQPRVFGRSGQEDQATEGLHI